jgi:hypothetical protein
MLNEGSMREGQSQQIPENETEKKLFKDIVPIDKPMSVEEAIDLLANYHHANKESIIRVFFALHKSSLEEISQVAFRNSISGGQECINIQVYDKEGKANPGGQLINPITGYTMMRVG